jgi:hypothetical protein
MVWVSARCLTRANDTGVWKEGHPLKEKHLWNTLWFCVVDHADGIFAWAPLRCLGLVGLEQSTAG